MIVDRFCRMRHASPRLKTVVGVAAALAAFAIACSKDSTGPGAAPVVHTSGALLVTTTYANPLAAGAPVVRARLIARYADATVAKDTIVTLPPGADPQLVSLTVLLTTGTASGRQDMTGSVRLIGAAGDTRYAGGPVGGSAVAAAVGSPATITIPLVYAGPGRTAKTLTLVPHDTALAFGDSIVVAAQVRDTAGALLPGTLVAWSSQDVSKVTVRSKFGGMLGGGTTRGLTRVIATTLTGQADTVNITTQPVATALALVSGSGQAGTVGTPLALPLRVRVTAADLLGVRFIPVTFTVTSGGGSVSSTTVVTDSGGVLSHSAICAREYAIPCVVATQVATHLIRDGSTITVDGTRGIVQIEI